MGPVLSDPGEILDGAGEGVDLNVGRLVTLDVGDTDVELETM